MNLQNGINSLTLLVPLAQFDATRQLYTELMGGKEILNMPGMLVVEMNNHFIVEIYTDAFDYPSYLFKEHKSVIGFKTDQLHEMLEKLTAEHFQILSDIQHAGNCYTYFYFQDQHGQVYKMYQHLKH